MPSFTTRLTDGLERAWSHLPLALVPLVLTLLDTNKIVAVLGFRGGHVGFKFGLPLSVITIWQFVSIPNSGVAVNTGVPLKLLPLAFVTVPVLLVVQATLTAGYFGSIRDVLDGESYSFVESCRQYFVPFLVLTILPFLLLLPLAFGVIGTSIVAGGLGPGVALLILSALIVFLLAGYLFYATPYLIVLRDTGVLDAAYQSSEFAIDGGPYFAYAVGYALFVLLVSPVATLLVVNTPTIGLPIGIVGGAIIGLAANITTMRFVADLDPESSIAASWESGDEPEEQE